MKTKLLQVLAIVAFCGATVAANNVRTRQLEEVGGDQVLSEACGSQNTPLLLILCLVRWIVYVIFGDLFAPGLPGFGPL